MERRNITPKLLFFPGTNEHAAYRGVLELIMEQLS
jgi:hypothetical protein